MASYLIVYTRNENVKTSLRRLLKGYKNIRNLKEGEKQPNYRKGHPELQGLPIIGCEQVKILKMTPKTLAYVSRLIYDYPNEVMVFVSKSLRFHQLSKQYQEVGMDMSKRELTIEHVKPPKNIQIKGIYEE